MNLCALARGRPPRRWVVEGQGTVAVVSDGPAIILEVSQSAVSAALDNAHAVPGTGTRLSRRTQSQRLLRCRVTPAVLRLRPNGSLDRSFGNCAQTKLRLPRAGNTYPADLLLDARGRGRLEALLVLGVDDKQNGRGRPGT